MLSVPEPFGLTTTPLSIKRLYRDNYSRSSLGFERFFVWYHLSRLPSERHGEEPLVRYQETFESMDNALIEVIAKYTAQGYESIAVICKTQDDTEKVYSRLKKSVQIAHIKPQGGEVIKGVLVIPSYMAKGLEFDVVIVYDVSKENYSSDFDKQLLYIACTRALHRLVIYYKGDKSSLI